MKTDLNQETGLLDLLRQDDTLAYETLFHRHWLHVYQFAYNKLGSQEQAAEITRKIFVTLWDNRHQLPVDFSFYSWLYTQLRRHVVEYLFVSITNKEIPLNWVQSKSAEFSVSNLKTAYQPVWDISNHAKADPFILQPVQPYPFTEKISQGWNLLLKYLIHDLPFNLRKTFM